jgi:hypothetical protein
MLVLSIKEAGFRSQAVRLTRERAEDEREVSELVESLILATDMSRHGSYMSVLRNDADAAAAAGGGGGGPEAAVAAATARLREAKGEGAAAAGRRRLYMELLIKCADTSNVLKPFPVARRWAVRCRLLRAHLSQDTSHRLLLANLSQAPSHSRVCGPLAHA